MRRALVATTLAGALLLAACGSDSDSDTTAAPATAAPAASQPADTATADTEAGATDSTGDIPAPAGTGDIPAPAGTGDIPAAGSAAECATGNTIEDGVLTIATGEPAFPPYVINDATPEDGQGFEAAVAMAVARELGFTGDAVTWTRTAFDAAIAPGPKDFDFNLQQYTITDERASVVDFSEGYYAAPQAVFGLADSAAAGATTLSDLKSLKIGVASGTTSVTYVEETIAPDQEPYIFPDNAAAKTALESGQIDAIVSDLPTALYITAVEIEGTKVFGQIEGSGTDEFGLLLAKDSPLTACVDLALEALRDSGELDQITTQWMSEYTEAPIISAE
jgi:polar amino acid transport system substrate-binding protein